MASKSRVLRLESELEKCRSDANWAKVLDLAKQISTKGSQVGSLVTFVQAECELERYFLENPPDVSNCTKAREDLQALLRQFQDILMDHSVKNEQKDQAKMLLAKIHYAMGEWGRCLDIYEDLGLETMNLKASSNRHLQMIAQSFAIKGLCLEKKPPGSSSKFRAAEREESIIRCYEKAGHICLVQLQEKQEKGSKGATSIAVQAGGQWNVLDTDSASVGPLVETAIQRSPLLYIRNGEVSKGIGRFRELLQVVETKAFQGLRQTLSRQLAEVLLRGVCESTYLTVDKTSQQPQTSNSVSPKKYKGDGLFCPNNRSEEILLLLLISESIASREALLNRSPEYTEPRLHTFHNATAVYDLITITLVKRAQYSMISETFERALKFSFDEFHIWYQFGLSLISAEKYTRGYLVIKKCLVLQPNNTTVLLLAAELCYQHLNQLDDGISHSLHAVEHDESSLSARALVCLGVGYSLKAEEIRLHHLKKEYHTKSLAAFQSALKYDDQDFLVHFHLARQLAVLREIGPAMNHVRLALQLNCDHIHSLHLLALLLSSQKQHSEALEVIEGAVEEYPDHFSLLFTRSKLEELVSGCEKALQTCKHMLHLWKKIFEPTLDNEVRGTGLLNKITSDQRSLVQLHFSDFSDNNSNVEVKNTLSVEPPALTGERTASPNIAVTIPSNCDDISNKGERTASPNIVITVPSTCDNFSNKGSVRAESLAASKIEHALSEVASSLGSSMTPKQGPHQTWILQTHVWLHLAECFLQAGRINATYACIQEAASIYPLLHNVSYMRGRLHEYKGDYTEAKKCYENAISINPVHVKSLQHLGLVLQVLGKNRLAEKVLRDAVNIDPTSCVSWKQLGTTLHALEDNEGATDCLFTAVDLENTSPILPFSVIPRVLR